ncbi:bacillithiol system redox-active protein YtxJ [candidate division KSB3 bacterium]|jgi:bacillithiol system protein YtxJ|uniref:Bacillithiol system redox-active protein YtxJ n=1 Tax=candidate division KSB3 bacterium TaxID=2044937 RepID=A0A9D5JZQ3_9BACT|nr:bacillithiol system redox-active protein YtxJ [candidate division KSB3 bacterium]MBD3326756.1 bacillithiol system redox-active protein YtxJ [candidate division KSB3 bacterium]
MKNISTIHSIADWETLKQQIPSYGLLVFKFSPRCPISRSVERDFDDWCAQLADDTALACAKVDVVGTRDVSRHLAKELNVRHESPQAIWMTPDQQVAWHASHRSINPNALNTQLEKRQG